MINAVGATGRIIWNKSSRPLEHRATGRLHSRLGAREQCPATLCFERRARVTELAPRSLTSPGASSTGTAIDKKKPVSSGLLALVLKQMRSF
jgi:hypothetical protein